MSATGLPVFDTTLQKTDQWLKELRRLLDWGDRQKTYLALRATLHALRDRLTIDETAQLAAQLPMLVRGFYYEGWRPSGKPIPVRDEAAFLEPIDAAFADDAGVDSEFVARAVFTVLAAHISAGEIEDVESILPAALRRLWPRPIKSESAPPRGDC